MKKIIFILISGLLFSQKQYEVDWETVAKIREEGFQRSEIANTLSYMTDVPVSYTHLTLPTILLV